MSALDTRSPSTNCNPNKSNLSQEVGKIISTLLVLVNAASKYYNGENRPYEFGFNIEGNQHRHEKKDENGIIMGEFGFITADNVYHVTVYATDENGNFKVLSMKNIKLMAEPMAKNIAAAIETMKSKLASSSPQPRAFTDSTTTPLPFVIHSTAAAPLKEQEIVPVEPTTQKISDIQSCSNCKIPEPPKPANVPSYAPQNALPPQMPQFSNRFSPQQPRQGISNLNLRDEKSLGGGIGGGQEDNQGGSINQGFDQGNDQAPGQAVEQTPEQVPQQAPGQVFGQAPGQGTFQENSGNQGPSSAFSSALDTPPNPPSIDLNPPQTSSQPAKEDYSTDQRALPEGRSLGDDQTAPQAPESDGGAALPEDMPIESVMARFKGVEPSRKQPDGQQNFAQQPRVQSPESRDSAQVNLDDQSMEQMLQGLLYLFNYTAGYHGHNEKGDREGNKEGGYYVVGRDGLRRSTEYRADAFGYQPKFKLERVPEEETPREETEKKAGLKGYEFKWFYL
ncbi:uncharacterized protein LOC129794279 [Lutzomyia longipalpis]|uniref:uncharacterized protein LOC129794279 n=1 Tax=Lutzomyia longipalpis TaxID=7200 RepID=UPI002484047E|nr:uncharacterized protein LOC129794279 [Lutzomyia longipalpis]